MSPTTRRTLALLIALAGCTNDDDGAGPSPTPTISVAVTPASLSVPAGATGQVAVTVVRGGGFSGPVNLALEAAPAGVVGTFTPVSLTSGSTSSTLDLAVASSVAPGTYSLIVRATGTGVSAATAALTLTVTAPPSFGIAVAPAVLNITQGLTGTATIGISRGGGFSGSVTLALQGAPAGMTGSFAPNPATGTSSTLTVDVGPSVPAGTYNLTVRGTATGLPDQTAPLDVTVLTPAGSFSLALAPAALTVIQGQTGQSTVTITRIGGFTGAISLALEGAPTGVTGAFVPNPAGGATSVLTLAAAIATAPGTYDLTIRGSTPSPATGKPLAPAQLAADQVVHLALTVAVAGNYTLSATPVTAAQGTAASSTVTITRSGGFSGSVQLSLEGAPAGVAGVFAPNPAPGTASILSLTIGGAVPVGNYSLTIRGSAAGLADQTASLQLAVTTPGSFTLSASPVVLNINPGLLGTSTITINRAPGFTATVAFTYTSNAPAGVTVDFAPPSTAGTTTTMAVSVGNGVTPGGAYTIVVRGNATGEPEQTTTVTVNIVAPGSGNVTWSFCDQTGIPAWLAVQDGTGAWTRVVGVGNSYTFNITTKGGVAWVVVTGVRAELAIVYGSLSELLNSAPVCRGTGILKTVNGVMANLQATETARVSLGGGLAQITPLTPGYPNFQVTGVADGMTDLFATNTTFNAPGTTVNAFIIRRGLSQPNGSTIPGILDWNGVDRLTPLQKTITITNGPGATFTIGAYQTGNTTMASLYELYTTGAPVYYGIPAAAQAVGDLHHLTVLEAANPSAYRSVTKLFHTATDQTLAWGSSPPVATFSWVTTVPYVRPRTQVTNLAEYSRLAVLSWTNRGGNESTAAATFWEGYGLGLAIDYTLPDFSSVSGWNNAWGLQAGTGFAIDAGYLVQGWVAGGGPAQPPATDGTIITAAGRSEAINP